MIHKKRRREIRNKEEKAKPEGKEKGGKVKLNKQ
jgi:hypothetical protein